MSAPIALQLYSLREEAAREGYETMVRKVAKIGYNGVETAGFPGSTPAAAAKLFKELGLIACSAHIGLPLGDKKNEVLDTLATIGAKTMVNAVMIGPADVGDLNKIKAAMEKMNESNAILKANGIRLGVHNHWWEFTKNGNRYVYEIMEEGLDKDIFFELDTYWIKVAGVDPAAIVKKMGKRAPLLHIKDGPGVKDEPFMAVGKGVMDFKPIFAAAQGTLEWSIVEIDNCATDMYKAVEDSFLFLKGTR